MNNNPSQKDVEWFHKKYNRIDETSCWNWTGAKNEKGYGLYKYEGLTTKAHRFAYMLVNPSFDQSLQVLHSCDNRSCVNPKHLFLGTQQDNMSDRDSKGRQVSGKSFLSPNEIDRILALHSTGQYTNRAIAGMFKITAQYVGQLVKQRGNSNKVKVGTEIAID